MYILTFKGVRARQRSEWDAEEREKCAESCAILLHFSYSPNW